MELIIFDIETTGLNMDKDSIIQLAAIKVDTDTDTIIEHFNRYFRPEGSFTIEWAAYFRHGLTAEFLKDKPTMRECAQDVIDFFGDNTPVCTYNGNKFDIPFLVKELYRYGYKVNFIERDCYDAFCEEKRRYGNTLNDTYKRYYGKSMDEDNLTAHDAYSDVMATYKIFKHQQNVKAYGPEPRYCDDNIVMECEINNKPYLCFAVGKYRGKPIELVARDDQNYLKWIVSDNSKFMDSTKNFIRKYIN